MTATQPQLGWSGFAAVLVSLVELAILSWCTLRPMWAVLPELTTMHAWLTQYRVALSNADVWLGSVVRTLLVLGLCLWAPTRRASRYGGTPTATHSQLRLAIGVVAGVFEAGVMAKCATVAVGAPEEPWPPPPSSSQDEGEPRFVGLVYMFTSLGVALLGSAVQALLARSWVESAQARYEAVPEHDSLEAPLLGGAGDQQPERGVGATGGKAGGGAGAGAAAGAGKAEGKDADKSKEAKGKVSGKTVWTLVRMSSPDWHTVVVAFLFGSLAALAQACVPYYTGQVIDYASIEPDSDKFRHTIIRLVIVSALCGVCTGCRGGLFTVAMSRLNVRLRKKLFHALISMEVGFYDTTKTGEITSRLSTDTTTTSDQICLNLNVMLRSLTQAAMVLAFMFGASWRLTLVTFILVPAVMTISKVYGKYFASLAKKVQAELAEANGVAEEVLSSMTTVKAHAAQDSAEAAYAAKLDKYFVLLLKEAVVYAIYMSLATFLPSSVAALVLWYGGNLVLMKQMSPGALVSFMLYQSSLSSAFQSLGDVLGNLTAAVGTADKVLELMGRTPQVDGGGTLVPATFAGHIELKDVCFNYPARPNQQVLRGLSLEVCPGQVVALVGSSGGGKSSIVKLVERFYLPQSGCVLLDGRDVGCYNAKWLRRHVALVSQEPCLYGRSIRRNICYGLEEEDGVSPVPSQAEVEGAAKEANAHEFISSFPEGYETNCGDKGVTLSGGQKQRLAIARALVRRPRVLLLDEATSALDADSEAVVQEALDRVMAGRTVLVIAHRLSTVKGADKIIVVGGGTVQEVGTHDELLSRQGVYASLVRRQLASSRSNSHMSLVTAGNGSSLLMSTTGRAPE